MATWNTFTSKQKAAAEQVFDALSNMDEVTSRRDVFEDGTRRIGFSDLYAFATGSDSMMDEELERAVENDVQLRDDLDRLLDETALYQSERVAAASTGKVDMREGEGFEIRLHKSRAAPQQIYIIIELKDPEAAPPTAMFLCGSRPLYQKRLLPKMQDGTIQILTNSDSDLVEALRDIKTRVFLR